MLYINRLRKRKMKRYLLLLLLPLVMMASCIDLGDDTQYYMSYGILFSNEEDGAYVVSDEGYRLNIVESYDGFEPQNDVRVVITYTRKDNPSENVYDVKLIDIDDIAIQLPLKPSELTEGRRDSIGTDPINISRAWFSAHKYLNLEFEIYYCQVDKIHILDLVVDEDNSTEDNIILLIRHNSTGDTPQYSYVGLVSYDISGLFPANRDEVDITLKWTNYNSEAKEETATFSIVDDK